MKFMTEAESKEEKAFNRLTAAQAKIAEILGDWTIRTPLQNATAISEVRHDLAAAVTILFNGDTDQ